MGASLWDQVGLQLLFGVAIQIIVTALCFLSVRLWNCLMKLIKTRTAVGASAHDQYLSDNAAAAHANVVPDLEMGNGYDPAEGGESMTEPELEMGIVNGGEGIDYFSDQETHTPVIKSLATSPRPRSREPQQEESLCLSKWTFLIPSKRKLLRKVVDVGHDCYTVPEALYGSTLITFLFKGANSASC